MKDELLIKASELDNKNYLTPKISVVMAVYNKKPFLERSVLSVLNQIYSDFELICIDGSSTDGGVEYLQSIDDHRLRVYSQPNQGISAAKNWGIILAHADLISFIDADDEWDNEFLLELVTLSAQYPEAAGLVTAYRCRIGTYARKVHIPIKMKTGLIINYFHSRQFGWGVHTSSVAITRTAIEKAGFFPVLLSSRSANRSWLVDGRGKIISTFENIIFESGFISVDKRYVKVPPELTEFADMNIEIPGPGAEDQYLHDLVALVGDYAFSNRVLSTWYGDVPGQDTKKKHSPVFPHILGLIEFSKRDLSVRTNNPIFRRYLKYIAVPATREIVTAVAHGDLLTAKHGLSDIWCCTDASKMVMAATFWKWIFRLNKRLMFFKLRFR